MSHRPLTISFSRTQETPIRSARSRFETQQYVLATASKTAAEPSVVVAFTPVHNPSPATAPRTSTQALDGGGRWSATASIVGKRVGGWAPQEFESPIPRYLVDSGPHVRAPSPSQSSHLGIRPPHISCRCHSTPHSQAERGDSPSEGSHDAHILIGL
jgi:hypothetical protein